MEAKKAVEAEQGGGSPHKQYPHLKVKNLLAQIIAASSKYLIMLNIGMGITFPTIAIPTILNASEGLSLTDDETTWFASLVFIFQPVGSLMSVPLSGLGRKRSMFFLQVPLFIAWLLPYFASTVWEIYFSSFVMGLGIGFMQAPIATYIGEVTQPKYRGFLACTAYCFLTLGSVLVQAIEVINGNWRVTALYCSFMPVITGVLLYIIPESPVWLVSKDRLDEGRKALAWLRGWVPESEVEEEFSAIIYHNNPKYAAMVGSGISTVAENCEMDHVDPDSTPTYKTMETNVDNPTGEPLEKNTEHTVDLLNKEEDKEVWKQEACIAYWTRPEMYRPLLLSAVFLLLSNGIGVATFRSYLIIIFKNYEIDIDEYMASVGVTLIGLIGNILSVVLMPVVGKRKVSLIGVALCAVGCGLLGAYSFYAEELNMKWMPIAIMILIFFATNLGVGHLPWVLMSEIFPLRGRTFATALVAGFGNFLQFLGTKLFLTFNVYLTLGGTFIMYAVTFVFGLIYLYIFLFETEGKTLDDIVAIFRGKGRH